jgi:hypothetical protein
MPLEASDMAIQARLAQKLTVDVALDTAVATADATGKALVLISATSTVAGVGTKFRDVAVPVILLEPNLFGTMGLTADAATDHGTLAAQTSLTIVGAADNPLTAGLTGDVAVYSTAYRVVFGVPAAAAVKAASLLNSADQSPIFSYLPGTAMVGLTAPAKRVGFFLHNGAPALTDDGTKLLDAAIAFAIAP